MSRNNCRRKINGQLASTGSPGELAVSMVCVTTVLCTKCQSVTLGMQKCQAIKLQSAFPSQFKGYSEVKQTAITSRYIKDQSTLL